MRTKTRTTSRASLVVAAAALAGAVLAGCGGSSASASALCKDYAKLGTVSGTDTATLRTAAALYRKLALEAPAAAKATAMAWPMPREAPVTNAFLPVSSNRLMVSPSIRWAGATPPD